MSNAVDSWPALSFLEGLRPGPDETVELAVLAAYSADLGSIGAALLALVGKDNDAGNGSSSDFADAVETLRGKARIVIQRGRLAKMRQTPKIAAVLDQFVCEVDLDEAIGSWHPKAALVKLRASGDAVNWRLWIGSRNLTECVNRDTGLLLLSSPKGGARIEGADRLAHALAEQADFKGVRPTSLADAVRSIGWRTPKGVKVERIRWTTGAGDADVPAPPAGTVSVIIVSPFVDEKFLACQTPRGLKVAQHVLLTTMREIERLGPVLNGFGELRALDAPDYPVQDSARDVADARTEDNGKGTSSEEEEIGRGLHAKLLFMRVGKKRRLWLGSANATMRAWTGRNVEVTAELLISEAVEKGLLTLVRSAPCVPLLKVSREPDTLTLKQEALERARTQVAARWAGELIVDGNALRLTHRSGSAFVRPHPDEPGILLQVGALNGPLVEWPRDEASLNLGEVLPDERSEFVMLRISRDDAGLSWLQKAPANPPFGEDRDRAAFARVLGARGFFRWLAALLGDNGPDDDGDWKLEQRAEASRSDIIGMALDPPLPTLEDVLAAWARNPRKFSEIDRRVMKYLPAILDQVQHQDPSAAKNLMMFRELWRTVLVGLGNLDSGSARH